MDVLRQTPFLGKPFNFTEIGASICRIFEWLKKKSKTEMHLKGEKVILGLKM